MSGAAKVNYRAIYPDFEISLKRYGQSQAAFHDLYSPSNSRKPYYKLLKNLERIYNKDRSKTDLSSNYRIPQIIHQIWLGGEPPAKYASFIKSWVELAKWEYRLWTDKDLCRFKHPLLASDTSLIEKADLLRLELLHRFGGLYVDTDVLCLNANFFEFANREYDFYAGLEPLENCYIDPVEQFYLRCGTAVLASAPNHPLLKQCLEEIAAHHGLHSGKWPVLRTGPDFFTKILNDHLRLLGNDGMIFPPTFFYPLSYKIEEAAVAKLHIRDETAAVHYFDISWRNTKKK